MDQYRRYNVERSCLRCHQRKVRCDKGAPCGACSRLNFTCQYPGPSRVKRQSTRPSSTDILARLEQLERAVTQLSQSSQRDCSAPQCSRVDAERRAEQRVDEEEIEANQAAATSTACPEPHARAGLLVKDGRYFNEHLLSQFLENDKELQTVISSPRDEDSRPRRPSPLRAEGIVTNPLAMHLDVQSLHPTRWQATQLWQTFLSRVDPVCKVLHIPSIQPRVFAAINRPQNAPPDVHALVFAIYFGATTSLIPDDPLRADIRSDIRRYQQGFEVALYKSSFLDAPTLTSLQALAIYQTCSRYHNSGRSSWTLHGLTIRAAQSIGLHRDGKHFNLTPLECELRRRVWWHLSSFDHRGAEDHGLSIVSQHETCNTSFPGNFNDQDLLSASPSLTARMQWTEMTSPLVAIEATTAMQEISRGTPRGTPPTQRVEQLKDQLNERYLRFGDPDIPIHRHGMLLAEVLTTKAAVCVRHRLLHQTRTQNPGPNLNEETGDGAGRGQEADLLAAQETLEMACHALERGLEMQTDELLRGYRWLTSTYTQYHLLTYALWHLCVHPTGPHVERAWRAIDATFELVDKDPSWPDPGPKWAVVSQLRAKASRVRDASLMVENAEPLLPDIDGFGPLLDLGGWDMNILGLAEWSGVV